MPLGNVKVFTPWSRKNFFPRVIVIALCVIVIALFLAWIMWGVSIYREGVRIRERKAQRQEEIQRQQEVLRRQVEYQRYINQQQNRREQAQENIGTRLHRNKKGE